MAAQLLLSGLRGLSGGLSSSRLGSLLGSLGLENVLDNLLLLNKESANNSLLHAGGATGTTISTSHGFDALGKVGVLAGTEVGDLQ